MIRVLPSGVLPMPDVFREAVAELDRQRIPIPYDVLTDRALARLGVGRHEVNWQRQIEDVREKLLLARKHGTAYIGRPHCLAVKESWFNNVQGDLINVDEVRIQPVDLLAVVDGVLEAWERQEHMLKKHRSARERDRMLALFKGFVVESQVKPYFRAMWPVFYEPPDNEGDVTRHCGHDFKLKVGGHRYLIDVFSKRLDGTFDPPFYKPKADLHLVCELEPRCVVWRGVLKGSEFVPGVHPVTARSPVRMAVWLNTMHSHLDYHKIAEVVTGKRAA